MNLPATHLEDYRKWAYRRAENLRDKGAQYANHVRKWMSDAQFRGKHREPGRVVDSPVGGLSEPQVPDRHGGQVNHQ